MSWFLISLFVLGLWKYDRCLLDKFQKWLWVTMKSSAFQIFKLYSDYKDRNEMIKDGYHVDSVFLFEHHSPTYSKKIDVLRIFRDEIVKETFSHKRSLEFTQFLDLCSDPESNFQVNKSLHYELEVNYTLDRKQYKIVYSDEVNSSIRFPIYSESEIAKNTETTNCVISAYLVRESSQTSGIDVSDVILKFAGPLGNFYANTGFVVKRSWLALSGIEETAIIKLMDLDGSEYCIMDSDEFIALK